jgi:soluble lytic murein transglycosylase
MVHRRRVALGAALLGSALGLALGNAAAGRAAVSVIPSVAELTEAMPRLSLPEFPHAQMALAAREADRHLDAGRPWAAWRVVRGMVAEPAAAPDAFVLLAARAAAGWDAWGQVRRLLEGRDGLEELGGGEGLYLLGRSREAREEWAGAAAAYRGALAAGGGRDAAETAARLGRTLALADDPGGAAAAYRRAAASTGEAADWMLALSAEASLAAGRLPGPVPSASPAVRRRLARAEAAYWTARGDTARAAERVGSERLLLEAYGSPALAAELALEQARLLAAVRRTGQAGVLLRGVAADERLTGAVRARAAAGLGSLPGDRSAAEELVRAAAYEAGNRPGPAARSLRAALRGGAASGAGERLRLSRLLFAERDFGPAREAALAAAAAGDAASRAEAELIAARAAVRLGRADGIAELRRVPERHPGTAAAGTALFLLGDLSRDRAEAIGLYRRAAETTASPDAREAHFRLGDRRLRAGDTAGALAAWEGYVARYPAGEATAEIAYRAGLLHERAGRADRARALYRSAVAADPVSYFGVRAADRAGVDPLAGALAPALAAPESPEDAAAVQRVLRRLDALTALGHDAAWGEELDAELQRLDGRPDALLLLAEGLAARGHATRAIRIGRDLLSRRGGAWDERLLRVVFPIPFRDLIEAEAQRAGVDAHLLAGLVRQESSFQPAARSRVGATGLSQIMPATGAWLAAGADATPFEPHLLTVPEVNLRMGARYLGDQLRRYGGRVDLALAAYNAGPGRVDRWRRELPHGGDPDRFRDLIPFDETRHYVRVVLRNAVVYRRLYGGRWSPGATGS